MTRQEFQNIRREGDAGRSSGSGPGLGSGPSASVACASGPAAPVERWLRDHGDVLWRFVLGRVRSSDAAEEIVQETLVAAMQSFARFGGHSSDRTWLLGIAAKKTSDHFRAARRRAGRAAESDEGSQRTAPVFTDEGRWADRPGSWGQGAGDGAERSEMLSALRGCIDGLPPSQAEAVWLRDLLDIPGGEVCEMLGISPTNLWSRLHRARSALRACVERSMGLGDESKR